MADRLTSMQWVVLENVNSGLNYWHRWKVWTPDDRDLADLTYLFLVENEYIKDGEVTAFGKAALAEKFLGEPEDLRDAARKIRR